VIAKALATSPDDRYHRRARVQRRALGGDRQLGRDAHGTRRAASRAAPWMWAAGLALACAGVRRMMPPVRDRLERSPVRVDTAQLAVCPSSTSVRGAPMRRRSRPRSGCTTRSSAGTGSAGERRERAGALQRRAQRVTLIDDVTRVARSVRAGRVVWGRVAVAARFDRRARRRCTMR
jgi:hypothetical protein